MLISVLGFSGLGRVTGVAADDQAALLRATADRGAAGAGTDDHILLLTPLHAARDAREQAHVLLAARRTARVCVLPLAHHALTLALVADDALRLSDTVGDVDPSAVWQLVRQGAARSRSVVWHPRLRQVPDHAGVGGGLLADLPRARGWFAELGTRAAVVTPGRHGLRSPAGATVLHEGEAPALLRAQLSDLRPVPVMVSSTPAPYRDRHGVEVTVLVPPPLPPVAFPPCDSCGAGLVEGQCPFCGQGPARADDRPLALSTPGPTRDEVA